MPLEAGDFIPELNANNPLGGDPKSEGDDHLRLVKRCTLGSFPAFVGNAGAPKSVTLTEDQINDAALKSAAQTVSGAWDFTDDVIIANDKALQLRFTGGTPGNFAKMSLADRMEVGNASNHMDFFAASGANANRYFVGGVEVARHGNLADGGVIVGDLSGFFKKAGFRNPTRVLVAADKTLVQADEGTLQRCSASNIDFTTATLEAETTITLTPAFFSGMRIIQGAGHTLRWLDGSGTIKDGSINVAGASIVTLWWDQTTVMFAWGNGISSI